MHHFFYNVLLVLGYVGFDGSSRLKLILLLKLNRLSRVVWFSLNMVIIRVTKASRNLIEVHTTIFLCEAFKVNAVVIIILIRKEKS